MAPFPKPSMTGFSSLAPNMCSGMVENPRRGQWRISPGSEVGYLFLYRKSEQVERELFILSYPEGM